MSDVATIISTLGLAAGTVSFLLPLVRQFRISKKNHTLKITFGDKEAEIKISDIDELDADEIKEILSKLSVKDSSDGGTT